MCVRTLYCTSANANANATTKNECCVWNATVFHKLCVWAVIYFGRISILDPLLYVCFADQINMMAVRYDVTVDARITMMSSLSFFEFEALIYI